MGFFKNRRLMQRLSSWFDQLPLRRHKNKPPPSRNKSKLRYSVSAAQQCRRDQQSSRWTEQRPALRSPLEETGPAGLDASWCSQEVVDVHSSDNQFNTLPTNSRPKIRTNPWYSQDRGSLRGPPRPPTNLYASVQVAPRTKRASLLGVVSSLDESTCSSGYGSQDSSPESSVHSPDWHPSDDQHSDKAVDCKSIDVDEALGLDDRFEEDDDDEEDGDYDPIGDFCDVCYVEEGGDDENGNRRHLSPPTFHAPPPPLADEDDFLTELSAKIDELRCKSDHVRALISRARTEREQRLRDKQTCFEQMATLRQMKWVVRNNFELIL